MKYHLILWTGAIGYLLISCAPDLSSSRGTEKLLREHSKIHAQAEMDNDLETFLTFYDDSVISMPEYQVSLRGQNEIRSFYNETFDRQNLKMYERNPAEFIHLGHTIVEIGTFRKEFTDTTSGVPSKLNGKYWQVWESKENRGFKITGESYGYFHPVSNPQAFVVSEHQIQPDESALTSKKIPFELKAYNALMEKSVRNRDGVLRAEFFTENGSFQPFADTTVTGIDNLRRYLVAYSQGNVVIDSIMCYTYDFETHGQFILEYSMFKVSWRVPEATSGRSEGKGIRIWQRQSDHTLRLLRHIGTHNHLQ